MYTNNSIYRDSDKTIPVFYAPDDNVSFMTLVSMVSILENTDNNITFYILFSNLSDKSVEMLNYVKKYNNCELQYIPVDENIFNGYWNNNWVTIQAWFRTLIPSLFKNLEKIIYLDCDTMVLNDIANFYNIDIEDKLLVAAPEVLDETHSFRIKLKNKHFFNSGVLLINCEKWRQDNISEKIKNIVLNNKPMVFGDEEVLNIVADYAKKIVYSDTIYIEPWWFYNYTGPKGFPYLIVHFTSKKPSYFLCKHSLRWVWRTFAKTTPYYQQYLEKYRNDFEEFLNNPQMDIKNKNF